MSALEPLHLALRARLVATAGVTALVGQKVFFVKAPTGTAKPFVTIGALTGVEGGSAFGSVGFAHTANVDAFAADEASVYAVAAAVKSALRAPLTLTGHTSTRLRLDFETILIEEDETRHMPMRFRTFAMETA